MPDGGRSLPGHEESFAPAVARTSERRRAEAGRRHLRRQAAAFGSLSPSAEIPRVCTYYGNSQLFYKSLITSRLRPRLKALKRKRVFAENQALEVRIMKLVQSLVVAAALAIPAVSSFAQSNEAAAPVNSP